MSKEVRMLNEISKALGGAEHVQRKDILEEIAGLSDSLGPEQHILPPSQVDPETGLPTVEDPEEGAFYLVPSGEDEPNLYNEYIWTGDGWELFGSGGGGRPSVKITSSYGQQTVHVCDKTYNELVELIGDNLNILVDFEHYISNSHASNYTIASLCKNGSAVDITYSEINDPQSHYGKVTYAIDSNNNVTETTHTYRTTTIQSGTLGKNAWSSNTQTIHVTGVTATNTVLVTPAPASVKDWDVAYIICTAQGANSLTFTCDTVPENDISVNVVILG